MTFKRFNVSEMDSYSTGELFEQGTLTWNPDEGLRIHDGSTYGGNPIGANTGFTRFLGRGIGSYDNGSVYDMTISPNWDGDFTGFAYVNLPSNDNFGTPLQIVQNSTGGVQIITENNNTWAFDKDGKLALPGVAYSGRPSTIANSNYAIRLTPTFNGAPEVAAPELLVYYDDAVVISADTGGFSTSSGTRVAALRLVGATASGSMESGRIFIDSGSHASSGPKGSVNIGITEATEINLGNNSAKVVIKSAVPSTSLGQSGDKVGSVAFSSTHIYYCTENYTDGLGNIWKRVALSSDTW